RFFSATRRQIRIRAVARHLTPKPLRPSPSSIILYPSALSVRGRSLRMSLLKRLKSTAPLLRSINKLTTAALLFGIHQTTTAQSIGGLSRARTTLETLRDNLDVILPIAAIIIGIIIFVLYSAEVMRKDDAIRWGIGVLLAGSAAELVVLLWK